MRKLAIIFLILCGLIVGRETRACSVLYYMDPQSGKIYAASNEDYWYDVKAYIQIVPGSGKKLARLWYGWDHFAQGGINEAGLFFDGAVTPEQDMPEGRSGPKGNLGDELLASCRTVDEALALLEQKEIFLNSAHMMIGDGNGNSVLVEWLDGERKVVPMYNNRLVMTNFLLSDPSRGNHPCPRYQYIQSQLNLVEESRQTMNLKVLGRTMAGAVQLPRKDEDGRTGGTLYSSFINVSDLEFVLVYQLDNSKITRLDLKREFEAGKKRKIILNEL
ncbi:MAG: hypothetical protein P1P86_03540 [Bacteroidales bacterium]|nr:hypothetical protein [Bacteroidales bacterium]